MRSIDKIIIHCSATPAEMDIGAAEIDMWHRRDNGWRCIGYHYVIRRNGVVEDGRPEDQEGAHVKGRNARSIGVCLVGGDGSSPGDAPADHYTPAQIASLRRLLRDIQSRHPAASIHGHNEFAAKACPGFTVADHIADILGAAPVRSPIPKGRPSPVKSKTIQASAIQVASGVGAAASGAAMLDGNAQIVALAIGGLVILAAMFILRERLKAWAEGWT